MATEQQHLKVIKAEVHGRYFVCRMQADWWDKVQPGQFMMVGIPGDLSKILGRPFCVSRLGEGWVEFVAAIVGEGTKILATTKLGDSLKVFGPLGKGFRINSGYKKIVIAGGGAGIAEVLTLCEQLKAEGRPALFLAGAKTEADLMYVEEIRSAARELIITTEDGSSGSQGLLTEPLKKILSSGEADLVVACGPDPMLVAVVTETEKAGVESLVATEQHMACGIGACYGCCIPLSVNGKVRMVRICKDGPIFRGKAFLEGKSHAK